VWVLGILGNRYPNIQFLAITQKFLELFLRLLEAQAGQAIKFSRFGFLQPELKLGHLLPH